MFRSWLWACVLSLFAVVPATIPLAVSTAYDSLQPIGSPWRDVARESVSAWLFYSGATFLVAAAAMAVFGAPISWLVLRKGRGSWTASLLIGVACGVLAELVTVQWSPVALLIFVWYGVAIAAAFWWIFLRLQRRFAR